MCVDDQFMKVYNSGENVGLYDYGMMKVHADFRVACDLLISERIKLSQLALDRRSIINKIIEKNNISKVEFEYIHAKTKKDKDEKGTQLWEEFSVRV